MARYAVKIARRVISFEYATVEVEAKTEKAASETAIELAEEHGVAELDGDEYDDAGDWRLQRRADAVRKIVVVKPRARISH